MKYSMPFRSKIKMVSSIRNLCNFCVCHFSLGNKRSQCTCYFIGTTTFQRLIWGVDYDMRVIHQRYTTAGCVTLSSEVCRTRAHVSCGCIHLVYLHIWEKAEAVVRWVWDKSWVMTRSRGVDEWRYHLCIMLHLVITGYYHVCSGWLVAGLCLNEFSRQGEILFNKRRWDETTKAIKR